MAVLMTSNPRAQRLIDAAKAKCPGCRTSWRLDNACDGLQHPMRRRGKLHVMTCTAQAERTELREITRVARTSTMVERVYGVK